MTAFRYSCYILDVIDAYCMLGEIDSTLIKQLMQQIRRNAGPITTSKEETVYIARRLGISYRTLYNQTGIALSVQSRLLETFEAHGEFDLTKPCLSEDYHEAVKRFMRVVDILRGV
jgi:hypothetical protein